MYPDSLARFIEYFKKLPGVGEKSAERMALGVLELKSDDIESFAQAMIDSKMNLKPCAICGHLTDKDVCPICTQAENGGRNKKVICILEDYKSVFTFEKTGNYNGVYHVLGGLISPLDDIKPEDINLSSLIKRVGDISECELIVALKSTIEGETTTLYIDKILKDKGIEITRLSYGIPMGAEIDYLDPVTLDRALRDRRKIS